MSAAPQVEIEAPAGADGAPSLRAFSVRFTARRPRVVNTTLDRVPESAAPPDALAPGLTLRDGQLAWADTTGLTDHQRAEAERYLGRLDAHPDAPRRGRASGAGGRTRPVRHCLCRGDGGARRQGRRAARAGEATPRDADAVPELSRAVRHLFSPFTEAAAAAGQPQMVYKADPAARRFDERLAWEAFDTVYDPFEAAALLRRREGLPTPAPDAVGPGGGAVPFTPVLWGPVPTARGWVQLPFLNLTEELYLRIVPRPAGDRPPQPVLLEGAAVFGNDAPGWWDREPAEHRWSVTVLDADALDGEWAFTRPDDNASPWAPDKLRAVFRQPELVLNGFLWLATRPPSAADALPDLDEWPASLQRLSLHTPDPDDLFPSPYRVTFGRGAMTRPLTAGPPVLGAWRVEYAPNAQPLRPPDPATVFATLTGDGTPFHGAPGLALPALAWQRHPTLPTVHTLPLTQVQRPPVYPSANRQLAPFVYPGARVGGARSQRCGRVARSAPGIPHARPRVVRHGPGATLPRRRLPAAGVSHPARPRGPPGSPARRSVRPAPVPFRAPVPGRGQRPR